MSIAAQLRSFYRRRISVPVDRHALVLDVGSGDKPHWRADVLLDRFVDDNHSAQRSGRARARVDRPLFDADAESMPFADRVFDYAICSHVLEHVHHPDRVISELTRVAKAGYIEVPEAASAKIVDFPTHLWWVTRQDDVLVFTAKQTAYFDPDIDRYLTASGLRQPLADLLDRNLEHRIIELPWRDSVACRVVGAPSSEMLAIADAAVVQHHAGQTLAGRVLTSVVTLPLLGRKRRRPIEFDDVVRADLRIGRTEPLEPRVYRVG
ncbi:MAG TPA: class I SAM-dependent methyltransferase [Ilumatobacteraceae bacterium]